MKKLSLIVAMLALTGCASMQQFGDGVCATQTEISGGITELGAFAGPPGMVVARALNIILSTTCNVIGGIASMPADVTDDVMRTFANETPVAENPGN